MVLLRRCRIVMVLSKSSPFKLAKVCSRMESFTLSSTTHNSTSLSNLTPPIKPYTAEQFKALPIPEQRVLIAQDVIELVNAHQLLPASGRMVYARDGEMEINLRNIN